MPGGFRSSRSPAGTGVRDQGWAGLGSLRGRGGGTCLPTTSQPGLRGLPRGRLCPVSLLRTPGRWRQDPMASCNTISSSNTSRYGRCLRSWRLGPQHTFWGTQFSHNERCPMGSEGPGLSHGPSHRQLSSRDHGLGISIESPRRDRVPLLGGRGASAGSRVWPLRKAGWLLQRPGPVSLPWPGKHMGLCCCSVNSFSSARPSEPLTAPL